MSLRRTLAVPDWGNAADDLLGLGWVRLPGAVSAEVVADLIAAPRPEWHPLPEEEGVVRQHGFGSYIPFSEADAAVRGVGDHITAALSGEAVSRGMPPVPEFNEATWTKYPAGRGHITAHRDPPAYGGVIAVVTLIGSATFRIWNDTDESPMTEWATGAGDTVILRGRGWPAQGHRCPRHEVEPPAEGERMIMTLRSNSRGAGGGYEVGPARNTPTNG